MAVKFEIEAEAIARLSNALSKLPNKSEEIINKTLKEVSSVTIAKHITPLIPVSKNRESGGTRNKQHARNVNWYTHEQKGNLEITVKSKGGAANKKGSFGYLVFPNEGRGGKNTKQLEFMEKGQDKAIPSVISDIENNLNKVIEEEIENV